MKKQCSRCKEIKDYSEFYKYKNKPYYCCKKCWAQKSKQWKEKNFDRCRINQKQWVENNREKVNSYMRNRMKEEYKKPKFRIDDRIKARVKDCMQGRENIGDKWEKLVGYTYEELRKHIESQFDENMNWQNYGKYWTIDHIVPIVYFKYKSITAGNFRKCWSLRNLRPLEKIANHSKGSKILFSDVLKE